MHWIAAGRVVAFVSNDKIARHRAAMMKITHNMHKSLLLAKRGDAAVAPNALASLPFPTASRADLDPVNAASPNGSEIDGQWFSFHGQAWQHGANAPNEMKFGEWMVAAIPPEKQFEIEKQCRALEQHPQAGTIAAKLLKQCYHQQEMLQAAVHEIARLELELMQP